VYYDKKQLYTPALEPYEFNERALIVDTETVGAGPLIEVIEVALCDTEGRVVYETLAQPVFNPLPKPSAHHRFDRAEFAAAPAWEDIFPAFNEHIAGRLLIAYNATFDRRALAATCSRYRQTTDEWAWRDAMQFVKKALGVKKSLSLAEACAAVGLPGGTHRAADDIRATQALLLKILGR
jgi:DNA polymerase III epsilon subunit-like protein